MTLIKREDLLTERVVRDIQSHALACYPQECLGYIGTDGEYHMLENVAATRGFDAELVALASSGLIPRLLAEGRIAALVHSHTQTPERPGPAYPTKLDDEQHISLGLPGVIVWTNGESCLKPFAWGDQLEPSPLLGRPFRHLVEDCYEGIRDEHYLRLGVRLKRWPRSWGWWADGNQDLYDQGFGQSGFVEVPRETAKAGDVIFFKLPSKPVAHHAGVLQEGGLVFHHPSGHGQGYQPHRLSKQSPLHQWLPYVHRVVRYDPEHASNNGQTSR